MAKFETSVERLLEAWERLGAMERTVLSTIAWRLVAGQRLHGELTPEKKHWNWEAAEEFLDASVYLATALVAITEESKRRYFASVEGTGEQVVEEEHGESDGDYCGAI